MDEIERLAVGVFLLLEQPGGDLRALVREGDAIELVLDGGGGLGGGLNHWSGDRTSGSRWEGA